MEDCRRNNAVRFLTRKEEHEKAIEYGNWWRWWSTTPADRTENQYSSQEKDKMNSLRFRAIFGLTIWLGWFVHMQATRAIPNTPAGMLLFHGSAAAVDLFLVYSAPRFLEGKLCDDTQNLCLASIVGNAVGWAFYLAYLPPVFYNTFMEILGYVQLARLFMVDGHDANRLGSYLVRRSRFMGA